jgi:hypothetical protein
MLKVFSGIFWSLVYVFIIIRGVRDKTYGMPMIALCANISWEFIFSFVFPHDSPQIYVNIAWFSLDFFIILQFLKFGKSEYPKWFLPTFLATLVLSLLIVLSVTIEFKDWFGKYAAFSQNLLMSVLFISLLIKRDNVHGQSLYIGIFKMLGTLLASTLFAVYYPSLLILLLSISTFIFDGIYIVLLYRKFNDLGINPWTRINMNRPGMPVIGKM